ncbi:MAG: hypothetical protein LJE93_08515 [Acidobacteria bacterium]|nr:hypothetical protein [Acidobacteriota bacterium]
MSELRLPRTYVVGLGEVGRRLGGALDRAGVPTCPVTRTRGWDEARGDPEGVCLVCVGEESLAEVLETLHNVPSERLILVQNGWIRPLLVDLPDNTRGLIWFTSKGDFFQILRANAFAGPLAEDMALALAAGGLPSEPVEKAMFDSLEADKMGFNCVVGLPLAVHSMTLGDYLAECPGEAKAVFEEAVNACSAATGAEIDSRAWSAFLETAKFLRWVRASQAKALDFRNQAVVALAAEHGLAAPANQELLGQYGEKCVTNSGWSERL